VHSVSVWKLSLIELKEAKEAKIVKEGRAKWPKMLRGKKGNGKRNIPQLLQSNIQVTKIYKANHNSMVTT
jgi:hypothetical protein